MAAALLVGLHMSDDQCYPCQCSYHEEVESNIGRWYDLQDIKALQKHFQLSDITCFLQYNHLRTRKSAVSCKVEKVG
jgi:hypothetical protein